MSHAMRMWNTAAATEHSTAPTSASERNLAADDAAATEHSELSADAVERHTSASPLPSPLGFVRTAGAATEHPRSALTVGTTTMLLLQSTASYLRMQLNAARQRRRCLCHR